MRQRIGDILLEQRTALGPDVTQVALAKMLGVSHYTYCRYERNHMVPSDETLWSIAKALGLSYDVLKAVKSAQRGPGRPRKDGK